MGHHRVKYGLPLEPLLGGLCKGWAMFWLLAKLLEGRGLLMDLLA